MLPTSYKMAPSWDTFGCTTSSNISDTSSFKYDPPRAPTIHRSRSFLSKQKLKLLRIVSDQDINQLPLPLLQSYHSLPPSDTSFVSLPRLPRRRETIDSLTVRNQVVMGRGEEEEREEKTEGMRPLQPLRPTRESIRSRKHAINLSSSRQSRSVEEGTTTVIHHITKDDITNPSSQSFIPPPRLPKLRPLSTFSKFDRILTATMESVLGVPDSGDGTITHPSSEPQTTPFSCPKVENHPQGNPSKLSTIIDANETVDVSLHSSPSKTSRISTSSSPSTSPPLTPISAMIFSSSCLDQLMRGDFPPIPTKESSREAVEEEEEVLPNHDQIYQLTHPFARTNLESTKHQSVISIRSSYQKNHSTSCPQPTSEYLQQRVPGIRFLRSPLPSSCGHSSYEGTLHGTEIHLSSVVGPPPPPSFAFVPIPTRQSSLRRSLQSVEVKDQDVVEKEMIQRMGMSAEVSAIMHA